MFGLSFLYCVNDNDDDKGTDVSFNDCDAGFRPRQGGGISEAFTEGVMMTLQLFWSLMVRTCLCATSKECLPWTGSSKHPKAFSLSFFLFFWPRLVILTSVKEENLGKGLVTGQTPTFQRLQHSSSVASSQLPVWCQLCLVIHKQKYYL